MKRIILLSFFLGIIHSILFWKQDWGISVFIFMIFALLFFFIILQKENKIRNKRALLLSIPILLLSATYFLFNSFLFTLINRIVIAFLFIIMTISAVQGKLKLENFMDNLFILTIGPLEETKNSIKIIKENFGKRNGNTNSHMGKEIIKGMLISLPLLLIIGMLLAGADETFASIFNNKEIRTDPISIFSLLSRILIIVVLTIYFIGLILKIINNKLENKEVPKKERIKIPEITLSTFLTLANTIYLLFTAVQVVHIIDQLHQPSIINYASYARNGFFQLMAVSIINFAVIIVSKKNKIASSKNIKNYIKTMNVLMAIFTVIILITSILRMNLYEQKYGYTFLRIMVKWAQITELVLIIPIIIYILKENFRLYKYFIAIITTMYVVINYTNIDYLIAKENIDRYFANISSEEKIDLNYLYNRSVDATPEIMRLLESKDANLRKDAYEYLEYEYSMIKEFQNDSWQSYNFSRENAMNQLKELFEK